MSEFYTYTHDKLADGKWLPFYVGKGKGGRAYEGGRNRYHQRISDKYETRVTIWNERLVEQEAFAQEIELIAFLKEEGFELTNMTDGGEGVSGWNPSDNWRAKKSHEMIEKNRALVTNKEHLFQRESNRRKEFDRQNAARIRQSFEDGTHHFCLNHPMKNVEIARAVGRKTSVALKGRTLVSTSTYSETRLVSKKEATDLLKNGWINGCLGRTFGQTPTKGRTWVLSPDGGYNRMVRDDELVGYLIAGWQEGRKKWR